MTASSSSLADWESPDVITTPAPRKPPKALVVLGILFLVAAPIAATVIGVVTAQRISSTVDGFARFPSDVACQVSFSEAGEYVVFEEYVSEIDADATCGEPGRYDTSGNRVSAVSVVGVNSETGEEATFRPVVGTDVSFSLSGRAGEEVGRLSVPTAGTYDLTVEPSSPPFVVAVGSPIARDIGIGVLVVLGVGGGLFLLGVLLLVVGLVRRSRVKKANRAAAAASSVGWPGTPGASGVPGGWAPAPTPSPVPSVVTNPPPAPPAPGSFPPPSPGGGFPPPPPPPPPPG